MKVNVEKSSLSLNKIMDEEQARLKEKTKLLLFQGLELVVQEGGSKNFVLDESLLVQRRAIDVIEGCSSKHFGILGLYCIYT